ncbi:restriction endonuclease subunit S [Ammoniphilus sp. 3BR4]|uniref:restriction endonuclease subunit S n=1 Tax=Ammoniphilus sp. 3BR4 TaxID=3158265 RepID=UPI00346543A5
MNKVTYKNYKETHIGAIPFEWEEVTMEEIIELVSGQSSPTHEVNYDGEGVPYVTGPEQWTGNYIEESKWVMNPRKVSPKDCFFITVKGSGTGKVFPGGQFAIGRDIMAITSKLKSDTKFLFYVVTHQAERIVKNKVGMVPGISRSDILNHKIALPKLSEQRKIATILTSIDEAIEKTEAIIKQTEKVKQGLMQRLLKKGISHTKFKQTEIGEIPETWDVLNIGDIAKLQGGYAFKSSDYKLSGIQLIRISNLFGKFLNLDKEPVYLPKSYLHEYDRFVLKPNDLIICMTGTLGKEDYGHVIKIPKINRPLLLNQRVGRFNIFGSVNTEFFYWYLSSRLFLDTIYKFGSGSKQANLSAKQIESILIPIPPIDEQEKIGSVINSVDNKTENEKQKLKQLKTLKNALMQVLLTGKVRVKVDDNAEVTV